MNLMYFLMEHFFEEEWACAVGILTTSILLTLIRANGLSIAISKMITALQRGEKLVSYEMGKSLQEGWGEVQERLVKHYNDQAKDNTYT